MKGVQLLRRLKGPGNSFITLTLPQLTFKNCIRESGRQRRAGPEGTGLTGSSARTRVSVGEGVGRGRPVRLARMRSAQAGGDRRLRCREFRLWNPSGQMRLDTLSTSSLHLSFLVCRTGARAASQAGQARETAEAGTWCGDGAVKVTAEESGDGGRRGRVTGSPNFGRSGPEEGKGLLCRGLA